MKFKLVILILLLLSINSCNKKNDNISLNTASDINSSKNNPVETNKENTSKNKNNQNSPQSSQKIISSQSVTKNSNDQIKKATLTEITQILGLPFNNITTIIGNNYVIEPGFDGVDTYHYEDKGINVYLLDNKVKTVQVVDSSVNIKDTNLNTNLSSLDNFFTGYSKNTGNNDMGYDYIDYSDGTYAITYYFANGENKILMIWIKKLN